MPAILGDINIEGHLQVLLIVLNSEVWRELWEGLHLPLWTFSDLDLDPDTPDSDLWHLCQQQRLILITANRNDDGPDSLEATMRASNTAGSLPVFTIARADNILHSRAYADRVVNSLLNYLFEIDRYRGTGRLYLP